MKVDKIVQIAIADDHSMIRDGLRLLIETNEKYKISIEASNGLDLVTKLQTAETLPDICIVDLRMGPLNGYETILVIKEKWPKIKTIVLSMYDDALLISKIISAGASSYLFKNCGAVILLEAIGQIMKKGHYETDEIAELRNSKSSLHITDKELHFLCLCCTELTYKEMAVRMNIEPRSVDNYRDSLFDKLGKHTRTGLAVFATTTGLVNLSVDYMVNNNMLDNI